MRAVIFDLWDTLVVWPADAMRGYNRALAERMGIDDDEFHRRWEDNYLARQTGPLLDAYRALGLADDHVETAIGERLAHVRTALVPRDGAIETLEELRRRGKRIGLISVCASDVPEVWEETALAPLVDAAVFSATCGLMKPQPEIYLRACGELGVAPEECLYVGDGANHELQGAREVGMTPVLICAGDREPQWPEVRGWDGLRVTSIPEVLDLT